jgi:hypothetical protein
LGTSRQSTASLTFAVLAIMAGCLPRGAPPGGRQVLTDRTARLSGILPSNGDGVLRFFVTRPGSDADVVDVSMVSVDPSGGPPAESLIVSGVESTIGLDCYFGVAPCHAIGPTGVVVILHGGGTAKIDVFTGDRTLVDQNGYQSQDGQESFSQTPGTSTGTLTDKTTGTTRTISDVSLSYQFVDDDFYYLTTEGALVRIAPSGAPQQLATGLVPRQTTFVVGQPTPPPAFSTRWTAAGTLFILNRPTDDPAVFESSLLDPITGGETPLPFADPNAAISWDGRWVLDTAVSPTTSLTFFDWRAGTTTVVESPVPVIPRDFQMVWRPGTAEAWLPAAYPEASGVVAVGPETPAQFVPNQALQNQTLVQNTLYPFTPDGAYWFSYSLDPTANTSTPVIEVGASDDPTGPRFSLNGKWQYVQPFWVLADDRFVAGVYTKDVDYEEREDAMLFDPRTFESRVLGERGRIAAVGQTRVMGMFHFAEERGDLTVTDIDTGRQAILAPEFATTAFAEPQAADDLAPGTRIVYQFQARTDSPYDGIWVTSCP